MIKSYIIPFSAKSLTHIKGLYDIPIDAARTKIVVRSPTPEVRLAILNFVLLLVIFGGRLSQNSISKRKSLLMLNEEFCKVREHQEIDHRNRQRSQRHFA
jgi:hypothetical protein